MKELTMEELYTLKERKRRMEKDFVSKETMKELTTEERMEKEFALKETNEEIRKCEKIISKLMDVRKQYEDYSNGSVRIDFTKREILEKEMKKIDDKIFSFINKKNNLKSVNDK